MSFDQAILFTVFIAVYGWFGEVFPQKSHIRQGTLLLKNLKNQILQPFTIITTFLCRQFLK